MNSLGDYREILKSELRKRQERKTTYTQGAFAKDLGISVQKLSRVLSGSLGLSLESALEIVPKLKLSKLQAEVFIASVEALHSRSKSIREAAKKRLADLNRRSAYLEGEANEDDIRWWDLPTYILFSRDDARPTVDFVAEQLPVTVQQAADAVRSLFKRKLLSADAKGNWRQASLFLHVSVKRSTEAMRRTYREMLTLALRAVDENPKERKVTFGFVYLSKDAYARVAKRVEDHLQEIVKDEGEKTADDARMYALTTALFPIDRKK